jgi:hypothetical protein
MITRGQMWLPDKSLLLVIHFRYPTATAANAMIRAITTMTIVILTTFITTSFLLNKNPRVYPNNATTD